ncbi:MAG: hypothetical protein WBP22_03170 [Candidatus Saccharimonas sp.]
MLNCRVSADPRDVLERYPHAVVLIREWAWTIPHTTGGLLRGVNFDTKLGVVVLNYDTAMNSRRKAVGLNDIKEASWNAAETEFSFTNDEGITVTIVPLD